MATTNPLKLFQGEGEQTENLVGFIINKWIAHAKNISNESYHMKKLTIETQKILTYISI